MSEDTGTFQFWIQTEQFRALQVSKDTAGRITEFRKEVEPIRQTLKDHKWLGGDSIGYADIAVAAMFLVGLIQTVPVYMHTFLEAVLQTGLNSRQGLLRISRGSRGSIPHCHHHCNHHIYQHHHSWPLTIINANT